MNTLIEQLQGFGLGDHESKVYAVLLETSPANATLIAKKCNLSRSSVYTTLGGLITKGLVSTTFKNEVKQFIAEGPESLKQLLDTEQKNLEGKYKVFEAIQKNIDQLGKSALHVPQVTFFEGQEGLKKIYLSMMRKAHTGSRLLLLRDEFVWSKDWEFIFEPEWHNKVKKLKQEKNITTQLLINDSSIEKQYAKIYKKTKGLTVATLPKARAVNQFAMYIMDDMVSILSFEKNNLIGIHMTNASIAKNFETFFQIMWNLSKK